LGKTDKRGGVAENLFLFSSLIKEREEEKERQ
jgi:hypothetical protein